MKADLSKLINFHDELNPKLWYANNLRREVEFKLLQIAKEFIKFINVDNLELEDVTISGSNCSYNYNDQSDIDLHLVVSSDSPCWPHLQELYLAKKTLFNDQHDIKIRDIDVEVYVQDSKQPHVSNGIYSLTSDKWIKQPRMITADVDETNAEHKYKSLRFQIQIAVASEDPEKIWAMQDKVKRMRKAGLEKTGEFGPENLAFKMLRNDGTLDELYAAGNEAEDKRLSLPESLNELNISQTLNFIKQAHGDQLYGELPYWQHPRAVALSGKRIFGSRFNSDAVKVAFLHDVLEDTPVDSSELSRLGFAPEVINAVELLTKDKTLTYMQNIEQIINSGNRLAMMVKYADNHENYSGDKSSWDPNRAASMEKRYRRSMHMLGGKLGLNESQFSSKQQVIDYFVKRGKTAAQGAAAWERGWRGPNKKPKLTTAEPRTDWQHKWEKTDENFADGKGPGRPGDSQRHGIPKGATMAELEKASHAKGRKGQLARWQMNMRRGKKRAASEGMIDYVANKIGRGSWKNQGDVVRGGAVDKYLSGLDYMIGDDPRVTQNKFEFKDIDLDTAKKFRDITNKAYGMDAIDVDKIDRIRNVTYDSLAKKPPVVASTGEIIDGNHRMQHAINAGLERIPVLMQQSKKGVAEVDMSRRGFLRGMGSAVAAASIGLPKDVVSKVISAVGEDFLSQMADKASRGRPGLFFSHNETNDIGRLSDMFPDAWFDQFKIGKGQYDNRAAAAAYRQLTGELPNYAKVTNILRDAGIDPAEFLSSEPVKQVVKRVADKWQARWRASGASSDPFKDPNYNPPKPDEPKKVKSTDVKQLSAPKTTYKGLADPDEEEELAIGRAGPTESIAESKLIHEPFKNPVRVLQKYLDKMKNPDWDKIDLLMKKIANRQGIDVNLLHKMWVDKYGKTPDEYCGIESKKTESMMEAGAMPIYYFSYGMLTDPNNMDGAEFIGPAILRNFQFELFAHANVHPKAGANVAGVLWAIDRQLLNQLDQVEGYPVYYDRKTVPVFANGKRYEAELYTMTPESRESSIGRSTRASYVKSLVRGYNNAGIPLAQISVAYNRDQPKHIDKSNKTR